MILKIKNKKLNWKCIDKNCNNHCCKSFKKQSKEFKNHYACLKDIDYNEIILIEDEIKKFHKNEIKKIYDEYYLSIKNDGFCPFLENEKCNIYNKRPAMCKAYPFYFDPFRGMGVDRKCPGINQGWTSLAEIKKYLSAAEKLYKYQIKKYKNLLSD